MRKKISMLLMAFIMLFGGITLQPKQSHAIFGMGDIVFDVPVEVKELVVDTVTTTITQRLLGKMVDDTVNWALGGFDGDPGFINNWDGFLEGTKHAVISDAFSLASKTANGIQQNNTGDEEKLDACIAGIEMEEVDSVTTQEDVDKFYDSDVKDCERQFGGNNLFGSVGNIAQQNYQLYQSGQLNSVRDVAETIATAGAKELNNDTLNSIIQGEGETLTKLLGSQAAKDAFKEDISVGGWTGYLALADPHNYESGLKSIVTGALSEKTTAAVTSKIQDQQTPQKFISKTKCIEYKKDKDGKRTDECARETTQTPGDQISALVKEGQKKELDQTKLGKELSDILAKALGRLTDGLLQKGLSSLGRNGGNNTSSNAVPNDFVVNYQSEYDVLGLNDNANYSNSGIGTTNNSGGGSGGSNPIASLGGNNYNPLYGEDGSTPFVGGPEDLENAHWNDGPEIIINLQEKLAPALVKTKSELDLYTDMEIALRASQSSIISLDKCLPGPDYNWQQRWQNTFDMSNGEDALALGETKRMANDPKVNIPGAARMAATIEQVLGTSGSQIGYVNTIGTNKRAVYEILSGIKEEIRDQFNEYKSEYDQNLPLFIEDWDKLSLAQKQKIVNLKTQDSNGNETFLLSSKGFYLFNENNGQTAQEALANNPTKIRDAVLNMSWDIWRKKEGLTEEGRKRKSELRYRYYIKQNDISTQSQILELQTQLDQIIKSRKTAEQLFADCHKLKAYALGSSPDQLRDFTGDISSLQKIYEQNSSRALAIDPVAAFVVGEVFGGLFTRGDIQTIDISNARTDVQIKQFLEQEYQKQQNNQPSYFGTTYLTSPGAIEQSILGFDTEAEKTEYFDSLYKDDDFPDWVNRNAENIAQIFRFDRFFSSYNRARGLRGSLFCRNRNQFDAIDGTPDEDRSNCIKGWYIASKLDYETAFANIN